MTFCSCCFVEVGTKPHKIYTFSYVSLNNVHRVFFNIVLRALKYIIASIFSDVTVPFRFSVSEVAESLLELVTDETKNGEALMVFPKGKKYMTFPSLIP